VKHLLKRACDILNILSIRIRKPGRTSPEQSCLGFSLTLLPENGDQTSARNYSVYNFVSKAEDALYVHFHFSALERTE
jgi:hypothetical protein